MRVGTKVDRKQIMSFSETPLKSSSLLKVGPARPKDAESMLWLCLSCGLLSVGPQTVLVLAICCWISPFVLFNP